MSRKFEINADNVADAVANTFPELKEEARAFAKNYVATHTDPFLLAVGMAVNDTNRWQTTKMPLALEMTNWSWAGKPSTWEIKGGGA